MGAIVGMKRNGLKGADSRIDLAFHTTNLNLDCSFCHELNLSPIDPPSNRMQMTPDNSRDSGPKLLCFPI